ncbi:hypothetical protein A4D02_13175 [Niastella koreensis]|uniref:Secretion system C-terminal sorting domain-containing protein n=2 Tax=Niastella koreensis TaxID=354356 RepID=G8TMC2_NIAKG|nr:T9SS type A sorting domain-containing protein [Niastella koreensis]AEW00904.1 hypothetical protein Niako_4648 [Niastella koreensis GR20-10]OQP42514.1 hypothetical protein A4D02_13175 [Niastella koreensis]
MKKFYRLYGTASYVGCVPLKITLTLLLFTLFTAPLHAQINAYAKVTAIATASGITTLSISNISQAYHTFAVGEQVIVIQMQDNVIGSNTGNTPTFGNLSAIVNAGYYQIATITALKTTGTGMYIKTTALPATFTIGTNSSVQVVSFQSLSTGNYATTTAITAVSWNSTNGYGGVVAFQVGGTLTLKNSITANGQGFAGGAASDNYESSCEPTVYASANTNYATKGEGIYVNTTGYTTGRGRLITGGGGGSDDNAGGAGGGNYSNGGSGGPGWTCTGTDVAGGLGGVALSSYLATGTRVFMGGGGGGGQGNNGTQTNGGYGGGIIFIRAAAVTTSCTSSITISANGSSASNTTGTGNDGAGGAGAGGTILIQSGSYSVPSSCPLNFQANGGNGGSVASTDTHGGGGGGGQGAILFAGAVPNANITSTTTPGTGGLNSSASGATRAGNGSGTSTSGVIAGIGTVLPVQLIYFAAEKINSKAVLNWTSADDINVTYNVQRSTDGFNFATIGSVKGTGNTTGTTNYTFTDPNMIAGTSYYRLEVSGNLPTKTIYSSIASLNLSALSNIPVAYPNPAHDHFNIRVAGENSNKTQVVTITDLTGQLIYTTIGKPTNNIISVIPSSPLKPGLYMFKITIDGATEQIGKVMIQ